MLFMYVCMYMKDSLDETMQVILKPWHKNSAVVMPTHNNSHCQKAFMF